MRKTRKMLSLLTAAAMTASAFSGLCISASAEDIILTANLAHTASAQGGSNEVGQFVDAETHRYNNWGTSGWVATAYADFTFNAEDLPESADRIISAELSTHINCDRGTRTVDIAYVPTSTIDLNGATAAECTIPMIAKPSTVIGSYSNVTVDYKEYKTDATDAVKAMIANGESEIVFAYSNGAAGGNIYGKGAAEEYQPKLTVTVADANAVFHKVTVKQMCDGEELSSADFDVQEGNAFTPEIVQSFDDDVYRYTVIEDNYSIDSVLDDDVIEINYTKRELINTKATVNAVVGGETLEEIKTVDLKEGVAAKVAYPKYILKDGKLYTTAQGPSAGYYSQDVTGTGEDQVFNIEYSEVADASAVYFSEAEDFGEESNVANAAIRCSNGAAYTVPADGKDIVMLSAGTYTVEAAVWGSKDDTYTIKAGDSKVLELTTTGSLVPGTSESFVLDTDTVVSVAGTVSHNSGLDYVLIKGTGTASDIVAPTPEVTTEPTPEVTVDPNAEYTVSIGEVKGDGELKLVKLVEVEVTPVPTPEVTPVVTAEPTPEVTPEPTPEATPEAPVGGLVPISGAYTFIAAAATSEGTVNVAADTYLDENRIYSPKGNNAAANKNSSTINGTAYLNALRLKGNQQYIECAFAEAGEVTVYGCGDTRRYYAAGTSIEAKNDIARSDAGAETLTFNVTAGQKIVLSGWNQDGDGNGDLFIAGFTFTPAAAALAETVTIEKYADQLTGVKAGDVITVKATGVVKSIAVLPETAITPVEGKDGYYTFVMPASDTSVTAEFEGTEKVTPEPTPEVTIEPTPEVTVEPTPTMDPTAVIDFTNRSLTASAKGSTTIFEVGSAADEGAAGLAAADAGNVLKIGSSQNGASKYLGYTAALAPTADGCTEYGGLVNLSFKLEPMQARTDKAATMILQFADVKQTPILPITVGTGNNNVITIDGSNVTTAFGSYYVVKETLDFNNHTAAVSVEDASGTELLKKDGIALTADNLAYLHFNNQDWLYGSCAIDDISIDAETIGTPVYYTATVNTERFAKLTTADGIKYFADVNGKLEIPLLKPNTSFAYTLSKVGYNDVTGNVDIVDADVTQNQPLTLTDASTIFIESEFGNENEAYVSAGGSRNDSIDIGSVELPRLSNIAVDFSFAGFGGQAGQQKTWDFETDGGKLVGIQILSDGMYVWTGWTGTGNMNQSDDINAYKNSVKIGDTPAGDFTVNFVVDTSSKSITVSYGDVSAALSYEIEATKITGMATGLYRYNGELKTNEIKITEPDPNYMSIGGVGKVAKIAGQTVTREYTRSETVITPEETFAWTLSRNDEKAMDGISIADGVLSITDAAVPGVVTITATGTTGKTASYDVTVEDFQQMAKFVADGPHAYNGIGAAGTCAIIEAVDGIGDNVLGLIPAAVWTSSDENVVKVDAATGAVEAVGLGTAVITATLTNGTAVSTATIPVEVSVYSITADAAADSTIVDVTSLMSLDNVSGYQVTIAKDGELVKQYVAASSDIKDFGEPGRTEKYLSADATLYTAVYDENGRLVSVGTTKVKKGYKEESAAPANTKYLYWNDNQEPVAFNEVAIEGSVPYKGIVVEGTEAGQKIEVAPIFVAGLGTVYAVPADRYNVTISLAPNSRRTDVYVNDQMMVNNMNQGSDNWTIGRDTSAGTTVVAEDVVIAEGYANFNLRDNSGATFDTISFVKAPSIVNRAQRVYVIGDSLVANYYGAAPEGKEGYVRTGWGQVLQNYISGAKVTNLGNSGAWATGMRSDAFTNVLKSAQPGDIMVLESGYNDRAHSTDPEMREAVTAMVTEAKAMGVTPYIVTPNASNHDYSENVVWSAAIREVAAATDTALIDLAAKSYAFFNERYGELEDSARNEIIVGTNDKPGTYNNATWDADGNKQGDKGLHSTFNAANCWASIIAQGLYDAGNTDIVDTTYSYTFNDGVNDITVKVTPAE